MSKGVAIVTGAAQGIGKAVAKLLTTKGYEVIVADLDFERASTVALEIGGAARQFDLAEVDSFAQWVEEVEVAHGPITALVNNAGICLTRPIVEIDSQSWDQTFSVNVRGTFFLLREVAERMKSRTGGSIVNLASISAFLPKLEQIDYGASKAAIVSLTRSTALVYGPFGIRINAVAPGVIDTPLTAQIAAARARIQAALPHDHSRPSTTTLNNPRIGEPEEVAQVVAFLLSDDASFVVGQTLDVCGGFLMR